MITTITLNPALDKLYLINDFKLHKLNRLGDLVKAGTSPGGKGINVSVFLQRIGIETNAMGFIGGYTGRTLEELVRLEGITTNFIPVENETRTDITIVDEKNNTLTVINESGPPIFEEDLIAFMLRYESILADSEFLVISGSIPPSLNQDIYQELLKRANQKNKKTILNTGKKALELAIETGASIVYPDMRSAYELFGLKTETVQDYKKLAELIKQKNDKIEMVIFTNPVKGIFFGFIDGKSYLYKNNHLNIVNLFGFGDAVVGGITMSLFNSYDLRQALQTGFACGIANLASIKKQVVDLVLIENIKKDIILEEI